MIIRRRVVLVSCNYPFSRRSHSVDVPRATGGLGPSEGVPEVRREAFPFGKILGGGIRAETRRLRDVLEAKGYAIIYGEHTGDQDYVARRGSFADGILALAGK